MPTALMISPHLDDAVFSAGATARLLADRGWRVVIATAFTRSVVPAAGFALECQRDKGLPDEADYMALRRDEDAQAAGAIGAETLWLDLEEAPHRGYGSAAALFGAFVPEDDVADQLAQAIESAIAATTPNLLMAPSALGDHVDHRRVLDAVRGVGGDLAAAFWRDVPYAIREPQARSSDPLLSRLEEVRIPVGGALRAKIAGAGAYATQLDFQFGSAAQMPDALRTLALHDGQGVAVERFRVTPAGLRALQP